MNIDKEIRCKIEASNKEGISNVLNYFIGYDLLNIRSLSIVSLCDGFLEDLEKHEFIKHYNIWSELHLSGDIIKLLINEPGYDNLTIINKKDDYTKRDYQILLNKTKQTL